MKVKVIKMANTSKRYEPEFKKKMVRLVLEEGRTIASVNKEYSLGYNGLINYDTEHDIS